MLGPGMVSSAGLSSSEDGGCGGILSPLFSAGMLQAPRMTLGFQKVPPQPSGSS